MTINKYYVDHNLLKQPELLEPRVVLFYSNIDGFLIILLQRKVNNLVELVIDYRVVDGSS